jgi:hypothetical protein
MIFMNKIILMLDKMNISRENADNIANSFNNKDYNFWSRLHEKPDSSACGGYLICFDKFGSGSTIEPVWVQHVHGKTASACGGSGLYICAYIAWCQ